MTKVKGKKRANECKWREYKNIYDMILEHHK